MTILAGIDEAGLGPTLGPLVTASAALAVPGDWRPETPWERLADAAAASCCRGETRPVVGDSKAVFRTGGIAALELCVGAFSALANGSPAPPLLEPEDAPSETHPCYSGTLEPFPRHAWATDIMAAADALRACLEREGARAAHIEAAPLSEQALNGRFAAGLNKNQALLRETGRHLRRLADKFADRPILAVVDKQGGRNDYLPFLMDLFPGMWVETVSAGAAESVYRIRRSGGDLAIRFLAKADRTSFPTALASEAAKYVRERAMAELNAWFAERLPGLRPTAGYPEDARRWLAEVRGAEGSAAWAVDLLVRTR